MRIAIDAMGGDRAPGVVVEGAVDAARADPESLELILVGAEKLVRESLSEFPWQGLPIRVVHAPEVVGADEAASQAVRRKRESSIAVGLRLQRDGEAEAFISAGNTGAVMAFSLLALGRLRGVKRPALAAFFPTRRGFTLVLDVGANADCKPFHLFQFGVMGSLYASKVLGMENPRVGLLSLGEESTKGKELTSRAFSLLKEGCSGFVGNIEGSNILDGEADVVVCDGFVGNAILKFGESVFSMAMEELRREAKRSSLTRVGAMLLRPAFRSIFSKMSYEEYGGAPLLGIDGVSVVCHGRSEAKAMKSAIQTGKRFCEERVNQRISERLEWFQERS